MQQILAIWDRWWVAAWRKFVIASTVWTTSPAAAKKFNWPRCFHFPFCPFLLFVFKIDLGRAKKRSTCVLMGAHAIHVQHARTHFQFKRYFLPPLSLSPVAAFALNILFFFKLISLPYSSSLMRFPISIFPFRLACLVEFKRNARLKKKPATSCLL